MATLKEAIPFSNSSTAIIVPGSPALTIPFYRLFGDVLSFQQPLADIGSWQRMPIAFALPNSYEFMVAFLATSFQRSVAAPLNPAYKQNEFEFYFKDLSSDLVLVPKGAYNQNTPPVMAAKKLDITIAECYFNGTKVILNVKTHGHIPINSRQQLHDPLPTDVALVLHTSGTTGKPKTVPLTHTNLVASMKNIQATYKLSAIDRTLLVMPLFHVHGLLAGFLAPLAAGGSVVAPKGFSASQFWKDFEDHKATWYTAVPTIHQILLKSPLPYPLPKIRFIRSCSSPLSPKTYHELEQTFGAPVVEAYAMTEAAHQMTSNLLPPGERKPGSVGLGQGVEVKILDDEGNEVTQGKEGEICVRGVNVTKGYMNNAEANKSSFTTDGFFRTGDQGKKDADGYVIITGRIKELINKGGEKISPIELDNVLTQHPAVSEAVSFAIDDEMYGQDIGVAIVLKQGQKIRTSELKAWVKERVAKFKVPKKVFFTESMPKTATGKIQRRIVGETMLVNDLKSKL
jgi:acyl-CoA synthetase (AMP-forming)/AMP-acid ligase II